MEKRYILVDLVTAKPMTRSEFRKRMKNAASSGWLAMNTSLKELLSQTNYEEDGYLVKVGTSEHWISKKTFESMVIPVEDNKDLPSEVNIGEEMVNAFIETHNTIALGMKSVSVIATLKNGFEITETSTVIDERNLDISNIENLCLNKIKSKVRGYLEFLLQTAWGGINK